MNRICPKCFKKLEFYFAQTIHRNISGWKKRVRDEHEREQIVVQYAHENTKRTTRVYMWGYAATGALGHQTFVKPNKFQTGRKIQLFPFRHSFWDEQKILVNKIACGYGFTLFLCKNSENKRKLYGTGINTDSQLGYFEYPRKSGRILDYLIEPHDIPLPLESPDSVKFSDIACGRGHSLVVSSEGIFTLGNNAYGQLGRKVIESEEYRGSQIISKLDFDKTISKIVCGQDHTLVLTTDGEVYGFGLNADGQLGQGHFNCLSVPTKIKGDLEGEKIIDLSSKADCVLAVSEKGDVFGWGNSEYSQLSSVSESETQLNIAHRLPFDNVGRVVKVAASGSSCALLNSNGNVYVWGYGILGKGPDFKHSRKPSQIPDILFGRNEMNPNIKVIDLECGISSFAAITNNGNLFTWGRNKTSVLGIGRKMDQYFPLKVHVPAEVMKVYCGVDHMFSLAKSYT